MVGITTESNGIQDSVNNAPDDLDDDYTPQNELSDEDLVKRVRSDLRSYQRHYSEWRKEARECYDFYAGKQWSDEDARILRDQNRPEVTFNRTARTVNAITGLEAQNRQEVNYKPMTVDSQGVNDLMNSAAIWVRGGCDAEDEESEMFEDNLICGMGVVETFVEYAVNPDGMIIEERFDPLEAAVDPRAKKRNCDDSRWRARIKGYDKNEFKELWPFADVSGGTDVLWDDENDETDVVIARDDYGSIQGEKINADQRNDNYVVVKYQYFVEEPFYRVLSQGQLVEFSVEQMKILKPYFDKTGTKYIRQKKRTYWQCLVCRDVVLERSEAPINGFSIHFTTGLRDRNRNLWFGIVSMMKDPQRWANKWLSQIQHILNTNAKGGVDYETGAFADIKKARQEMAKPDGLVEYNPGFLQNAKVQKRQPIQYPEGIDRLLQQALTAISDVPGVNVEMLGVANRNQPGIVEDGRKNAGVTIITKFFDSLRRFRKEQGRALAEFIRVYISDGRLIRIDQVNGSKYAELLKDKLTMQYDIIVDDAPSSANMKEKVYQILLQMLPMAMQAGIPIPPEILDYSPLPSALVEKWTALIAQQKNDPQVQQKANIALQQGQAEVQRVQAETGDLTASAKLKMAEAMVKSLEAQSGGVKSNPQDLQIESMKGTSQIIKSQAEIESSKNDVRKSLIDAATQHAQHQHDLKMAAQQPRETP